MGGSKIVLLSSALDHFRSKPRVTVDLDDTVTDTRPESGEGLEGRGREGHAGTDVEAYTVMRAMQGTRTITLQFEPGTVDRAASLYGVEAAVQVENQHVHVVDSAGFPRTWWKVRRSTDAKPFDHGTDRR